MLTSRRNLNVILPSGSAGELCRTHRTNRTVVPLLARHLAKPRHSRVTVVTCGAGFARFVRADPPRRIPLRASRAIHKRLTGFDVPPLLRLGVGRGGGVAGE
jgi:hypothetical protein